MASKFGFSGLNSKLNSVDTNSNLGVQISNLFSKTLSVRVKDIILDETHPDFQKYGEWNGIGTIKFETLSNQITNPPQKPIAKPLFPQFKTYPLVNELVYLIKLPDYNLGNQTNSESYYYLSPISLWNHPHHNAYPNEQQDSLEPISQQKTYQEIENGSQRVVTNDTTEVNLNSPEVGGTFVEKTNIHPILPFAGDVIVESRFGNSIRLGNTSKSKSTQYPNNWSESGENGDPITIIRNGQPPSTPENGFLPIVEDINKDLSSIYLTSKQTIPVETDITSNPSISTPPQSVSSYNKNQIILKSGRLVLNTNLDSIILDSKKSISLTSIEDIGLYSKNGNVTLSGKNIKLGDINASQSLILGDSFMEQFTQLLTSLSLLMDSLTSEPTLGPTSLSSQNTKLIIDSLKDQIPNLLSKTSKTL